MPRSARTKVRMSKTITFYSTPNSLEQSFDSLKKCNNQKSTELNSRTSRRKLNYNDAVFRLVMEWILPVMELQLNLYLSMKLQKYTQYFNADCLYIIVVGEEAWETCGRRSTKKGEFVLRSPFPITSPNVSQATFLIFRTSFYIIVSSVI